MVAIVAARCLNPAPVPAPARALRRAARAAAVWVLAFSLSGCAWLSAKQSQLALRPTPGRPAELPDDSLLFRPGDQRWLVPVPAANIAPGQAAQPAQQVALWWLPHADPQAPTLLYLHGTFRNLYRNLPKINALREAGFSIVAVDYRGWGESTVINPDEESIAADARAAWAELQRRQPNPQRRVLYGHSMGSAVAVRLASTLKGPAAGTSSDYAALVLESAFTRLPDVAAMAGWVGRIAAAFTTLDFDSRARIGRVDAPLLMLHGEADTTVPAALGRQLRDAALQAGLRDVRWVEVAGGTHSQLHSQAAELYSQTFRDLIQRLAPGPALATGPSPLPLPPPQTSIRLP